MSASAEPVPVVEDAAPVEAPTEAVANGTATEETPAPASEKPKSASKSSGNKKVARGGASGARNAPKKQTAESSRTYAAGDIVLARLKGYPPWPARIVDPEQLPTNVLAQRPGKSPHIYCAQYFPAGDFSWLPSKELQPLPSHDITAFLEGGHRKASGQLMEAYKTAQDPTDWIAEHEAKQLENEGPEEDELADDDEDAATGDKRKRGTVKKDSKSKAKSAKKAKVNDSEEPEPKSKGKTAKPKSAKATAKKESKPAEPENQATAEEDPLANDPEATKVKDWRHKLQRAFLGKGLPTADDMGTYDELFKTIEGYEKMTIEYLQHSKIGKVMKKIATLTEIPRNEELKITDRASKLMTDWTDFISNSEKKEANGNGDAKPESKAEGANGDKAEEA